MYKLYNFDFSGSGIRVVPISGEAWLSAQDVSQLATDAPSQASYLVTKRVAERNVKVIRHQDIDFQDEEAQSHFASLTFVRAESVQNIAKEAEKNTSRFVEWLGTLERLLSEDDKEPQALAGGQQDWDQIKGEWPDWAEENQDSVNVPGFDGIDAPVFEGPTEGADDHEKIQLQLKYLERRIDSLRESLDRIEASGEEVSRLNRKVVRTNRMVSEILQRITDIGDFLAPVSNGSSRGKGTLSRWISKIT